MKIDELIRQRKDQLDVESPPQEVWDKIRLEISDVKEKQFQWWRVAAVIFICVSIGLVIQNRLLRSQVRQLATLGDISEQYAGIEQDYISQVRQLEQSTSINDLAGEVDYAWVFEELRLLEEINQLYRSDIGTVNEELLVEVLIDYYEKKIKLLKKLELELERNSNRKQNEKVDTDYSRI